MYYLYFLLQFLSEVFPPVAANKHAEMAVIVGVPNEIDEREKRVALVPDTVKKLTEMEIQVLVARGAGVGSGHTDDAYGEAGARLVDASALATECQVMLRVTPWTPKSDESDKSGNLPATGVVVGFMNPFGAPDAVRAMCANGISSFAMELMPRTTRAQAMDGLSSQRTALGYKGLLIGAAQLNRFFPMLTTPAGTVRPATVLVVGTGVAGLQAIATARRLGANVIAQDVRSDAKEQVESLGAKFVSAEVEASGEGGYARELTAEEKAKQAALLARVFAEADLVITTAAIPGLPAPKIVKRETVESMKPGSVLVDCAAEGGGNCELTQPGETIEHAGVFVCGPLNVPSMLSYHASDMYSKNLANFLALIVKDNEVHLDFEDDIVAGSCLTHGGKIMNERIAQTMEGSGV